MCSSPRLVKKAAQDHIAISTSLVSFTASPGAYVCSSRDKAVCACVSVRELFLALYPDHPGEVHLNRRPPLRCAVDYHQAAGAWADLRFGSALSEEGAEQKHSGCGKESCSLAPMPAGSHSSGAESHTSASQ